MEQITYILGAGASYWSMPLVKSFVERFKMFQHFLSFENETEDGRRLIDACQIFISEVGNHLSFDTFFKKLFHQGKEDLILQYKKVLLLFFIYEHLVDLKATLRPVASEGQTINLDPRYDALIAGLLKPKERIHLFLQSEFYNLELSI